MKKNVLFVANNIDGGIASFLKQFSNLSSLDGNLEINLLVLKKPRHTDMDFFQSKVNISKYENRYHISNKVDFVIRFVWELVWLRQQIVRNKPAVIISIDTHANVLCLLLKKLLPVDVKNIITNHNNVELIVSEKLSKIGQLSIRFIGKHLFSTADTIVCLSDGLGKSFKTFFSLKKKITVIPYQIDIDTANISSAQPLNKQDKNLFASDKKTIISIGRLEKQKNFDFLIKSFVNIHKKVPDSQLIIIGDGSEKMKLVSTINTLGLEKLAHLIGWRKNVYPFLAQSKLFVLCSKYEGFGYVLLEAMSQGVPILSTNAPYGPDEILEKGKYGLVVPLQNKKKFVDAVVMFLTNQKVSLNYRNRAIARAKMYSGNIMLKKYMNIINSLDNDIR